MQWIVARIEELLHYEQKLPSANLHAVRLVEGHQCVFESIWIEANIKQLMNNGLKCLRDKLSFVVALLQMLIDYSLHKN